MMVVTALAGIPASQYWYGPPSPAYADAFARAKSLGYSIPLNNLPVAGGAMGLEYVNPDGTLGQIMNWQAWPLSVNDPAFIAPASQTVWSSLLSPIGLTLTVPATTAEQHAASQATPTPTPNPPATTVPPTVTPHPPISTPAAQTTNPLAPVPPAGSAQVVNTPACSGVQLGSACISYLVIGVVGVGLLFLMGRK